MQENDKKDRNRALATTLSVHTVLLIFFFFYGLTYQDPPPEYGIPVSFGNSMDGAGDDAAAPEGSEAPSTAAAESSESEVVTQELVDAPSVSSTKAKEDKKSEVKPEAKPVAEAPKASKELSNRLNSKFGKTGGTAGATGSGQGSTSGGGDQCAPNGSGNGNGTGGSGNSGNYQLGNRSALERPKPRYDCEGEGVVVVKVYVDRSGTVTRADGQGQKGSTTSEECLIRRAQEAALKTRWQGDPSALELQVGSIRYSFQRN
jgi:outer membrane biosynthesis protein TonB